MEGLSETTVETTTILQKKIQKNHHRIKALLEELKKLSRMIEEKLHWREVHRYRMSSSQVEEFQNYAMLVENNSRLVVKECKALGIGGAVMVATKVKSDEEVLGRQNRILALLNMNLLYKEHILGMVM